jgi:hypothetical protein
VQMATPSSRRQRHPLVPEVMQLNAARRS